MAVSQAVRACSPPAVASDSAIRSANAVGSENLSHVSANSAAASSAASESLATFAPARLTFSLWRASRNAPKNVLSPILFTIAFAENSAGTPVHGGPQTESKAYALPVHASREGDPVHSLSLSEPVGAPTIPGTQSICRRILYVAHQVEPRPPQAPAERRRPSTGQQLQAVPLTTNERVADLFAGGRSRRDVGYCVQQGVGVLAELPDVPVTGTFEDALEIPPRLAAVVRHAPFD